MADDVNQRLDEALKQLAKQGKTVWGFILDDNQLATFNTLGDSVDMFIYNTEEGLRALKEQQSVKGEPN